MQMKHKLLIIGLLMASATTASAQQPISLDSCRALALRNNKELRMGQLKQDAAHWQHKAATSHYYPRLNVMGAYMRTNKEISLLNDDQKQSLSNLGTTAANGLQQTFGQVQQAMAENPLLAALMQDPVVMGMIAQSPALQQLMANREALIGSMVTSMGGTMAGALNAVGQGIVDAFHTDTRNMTGLTAMLTQPLYMGGKIRAYDKITHFAEQIAANQHDMQQQATIVEVDEAYWRIVGLQSKHDLAKSYLATVQKLDADVQKLIKEGFATQADGLSVAVKVNEAEVTLLQVENGLELSRMALCQLCGLPLDTPIQPADQVSDAGLTTAMPAYSVHDALENRPELRALELAARVKDEQVKVARSELMPNLALTAGYIAMSPGLFNGFERKMNSLLNVGVVLKVPVVTWGERLYKVRQAKAEAAIAHYEVDEVREKVELQVQQSGQKLSEAMRRYQAAHRAQEQADENLRIANLGMKEGVIPVSNVLQAQTAWLSAKSTLIQAQIDQALAQLYLNKALGSVRQ